MANLKPHIYELLEESQNQITSLKKTGIISRVKVKNILENLRSALEYSAQTIDQTQENPKGRIFFPFGENQENFVQNMRRNFPKIEPNNEFYVLIESIQNHKLNDNWLPLLCIAVNIVKHNKGLDIGSKTQQNKKLNHIKGGGINLIKGDLENTVIILDKVTINGLPADDAVIDKGNVNIIKPGKIKFDFDFDFIENKVIIINDINTDLFEFLDKCQDQILDFVDRLFVIIENE